MSVILSTANAMEETYAKTRAAGRDTDALEVIGYQKSGADGDKRVRLIFGLDTVDLKRYGFEMTLYYVDANGDRVRKSAEIESYTVFTSIIGKDENGNDKTYTANTDYGCGYFATLVINPTINGQPISGGATVTVTAYTADNDGYTHSYGAEMITLVFDGNGDMISPAAGVN